MARPMVSKRGLIIAGILLLVAGWPTHAYAWGPATHIKLACDVLENAQLLAGATAVLLGKHVKHYLFGNIAADVVTAKRLSKVRQVCHHWATGFAILDDARNDQGRAFALGYLSHLAADTVAHGKFLPRQMTMTRSTMSFGHVYWELRADATLGPHYWQMLRTVLAEVYAEHERVLAARLKDTFLPFSVNWRLFYRMNRFVGRHLLRRAMDGWYRLSRWQLCDQMMREYRAESLERIVDVLEHGRHSWVCHYDPNGNAALAYTRAQRRQLRQMARLGLIVPHLLYEVAAAHAPELGGPPALHVPMAARTAAFDPQANRR